MFDRNVEVLPLNRGGYPVFLKVDFPACVAVSSDSAFYIDTAIYIWKLALRKVRVLTEEEGQ